MPEISFMTVTDIDGESNVQDQSDKIEVICFSHEVSKETNPLDCSVVVQDRRHGAATVLKRFDKASPLLNQKLCEGGTIDEIKIEWYRQPDGGGSDPEHYYTHTFVDCIITKMEACMPNALDPLFDRQGHMERVSWGYRELTWKSETGSTEFADQVRE